MDLACPKTSFGTNLRSGRFFLGGARKCGFFRPPTLGLPEKKNAWSAGYFGTVRINRAFNLPACKEAGPVRRAQVFIISISENNDFFTVRVTKKLGVYHQMAKLMILDWCLLIKHKTSIWLLQVLKVTTFDITWLPIDHKFKSVGCIFAYTIQGQIIYSTNFQQAEAVGAQAYQ